MKKTGLAGTTARFVSRTGAVIVAAVILTFLTAISLVLVTTDKANRDALAREKDVLVKAIDSQLETVRSDMAKVAGGYPRRDLNAFPIAKHSIVSDYTRYLWSSFDFTAAFIIDADGKVLLGEKHGQPSGQGDFETMGPLVSGVMAAVLKQHDVERDSGIPRQIPRNGDERGTVRLVYDGVTLFAAVAVPVYRIPEERVLSQRLPLMAIGVKELGEGMLMDVAARQGLNDFAITRSRPAGKDAVALGDGEGATTAFIHWTPEKPGDPMFRNAVAIIAFSIVFIVMVLFWLFTNLRNATDEMLRREEMIGKIAAYDELSGLHNRRSFDLQLADGLARTSRGNGIMAVLLLDLDKFKPVNDLHGHKVGDDVICGVARRLREIVRSGDCVARLGGDEFAILQTDISNPCEVAVMGQRILDSLREPFEINDIKVSIGVSIGIAIAPTDTGDRDALLRMADTALYQAKNEGRNRFSFFEREMDRSMQMSRIVADDLRNAIDNDELVLHYQPQMSADGLKILGVEALVRWNHPVHGMIPPNDFISIAEQRGLIMPLSQWVLRRACHDMKPWPDLRLAVNISPIDFRNADFVGNVSRVIGETGFDPARLELELTEGVVVEDADLAEQAMIELRGLGVGLALDDFGTGYSSLIYLRRFAFDKIKIDRSFLEYMETTGESAVLVHSVVHLGRALGLRVCAEGVETAEQHRFLQAVGCHELQGYFFSRPVPLPMLEQFIASKQGKDASVLSA